MLRSVTTTAPGGRELVEVPGISMDALVAAGLQRSDGKWSRMTEEIKLIALSLRHKLSMPAHKGQPAIIMVSSANPGEGKSYVSLNVAAGLAIYGRRKVMLVDMDSKAGSMSAVLGVGGAPGVVDYAVDPSLDVSSLVIQTAVQNLSFIPVGVGDGHAGEETRLPAEAVEDAYARLGDRVFVVDCPPCMSLAEPKAMAYLATFMVFVVLAEVTQVNEVENAIEHVAHKGLDVNLLLNRTYLSGRDSFGSYANYG